MPGANEGGPVQTVAVKHAGVSEPPAAGQRPINLLQMNAQGPSTSPQLAGDKGKNSPTLRSLRPGGGSTIGSLRPDASKGGAFGPGDRHRGWQAGQQRGSHGRGRRGGRRKRRNNGRGEGSDGKLSGSGASPTPDSQAYASPKRGPPGFAGNKTPAGNKMPMSAIPGPSIQMPAAQRSPAAKPARQPQSSVDHGAEHKTYPFHIMMAYRRHHECARLPPGITLPKSTARKDLNKEQRAREYPFFTMAKHKAQKRARAEEKRRMEEKQEREARARETREPDMEEVMTDDRPLDWVDEDVPEEDFDFSAAVMARDLPGRAKKKSASPPSIRGGDDPIARMTQNLASQRLPPMPTQSKVLRPPPRMPVGTADADTIEKRARQAQEDVIGQIVAGRTGSAETGEILLEELDDQEAKADEFERDAERLQREQMREEQLKLERLLSQGEDAEAMHLAREKMNRRQRRQEVSRDGPKGSPPMLNMETVFGTSGRHTWEAIDSRARGPEAVQDGVAMDVNLPEDDQRPAPAAAAARDEPRPYDVQSKAREALEKMRRQWGDVYLKQYVKMKYGQMMQNSFSQGQYARMQQQLMQSLYTNPANGGHSFPQKGNGPGVDQLRAYYMRYQQFMRKLATTDPARLQKLQMYVMQKYGRLTAEKYQQAKRWTQRRSGQSGDPQLRSQQQHQAMQHLREAEAEEMEKRASQGARSDAMNTDMSQTPADVPLAEPAPTRREQYEHEAQQQPHHRQVDRAQQRDHDSQEMNRKIAMQQRAYMQQRAEQQQATRRSGYPDGYEAQREAQREMYSARQRGMMMEDSFSHSENRRSAASQRSGGYVDPRYAEQQAYQQQANYMREREMGGRASASRRYPQEYDGRYEHMAAQAGGYPRY